MNVDNAPQLIIQTTTDVRAVKLLEHREWTIGRDQANLIQIFDRYASRFHAILGVFEDRHVYFRDLNSRNGSFIDGQRLMEPMLLKHGDRITIGNTVLVLKHHYVTTANGVLLAAQKQVLMIHGTAVQGKIWQEILLSQNIDVLWEVPGADIQQIIRLQASANILPPLLILDIQSIQRDISGLGEWCRRQGLSVQILLIDSRRISIPELERANLQRQGFLDLLPAFSLEQLSTPPVIFPPVLKILTVYRQTLNQNKLVATLRTLSQLLSKPPIIVSATRQAELDVMNTEDLTSLKVDPRKLKRQTY